MKKHIFIINPVAGKKKALTFISYIKENFENPIIITTEYEGHATKIASEYKNEDVIIYSLGGDGTLNEIINGIVSDVAISKATVAVVPLGSGNDFTKSITDKKDPLEILKSYRKIETKTVDLGLINGRYFINIASVGFDANIAYKAKSFKKLPLIKGEMAYLLSVFKTIINLKAYKVKMLLDDHSEQESEILLIAIANAKYYGGGMKPLPSACFDDGILDVCIVKKLSRFKVLKLLPKYIKGKHENFDEVELIRVKDMKIRSNTLIPVNIDGEVRFKKNIDISIIKNGIDILVP